MHPGGQWAWSRSLITSWAAWEVMSAIREELWVWFRGRVTSGGEVGVV